MSFSYLLRLRLISLFLTWLTALAVQSDKPFRGLEIFGTGFLSKFQSSEVMAPLLESMILIDTPGVLSGEKQRIGRA